MQISIGPDDKQRNNLPQQIDVQYFLFMAEAGYQLELYGGCKKFK
jgi:hypothetical protein